MCDTYTEVVLMKDPNFTGILGIYVFGYAEIWQSFKSYFPDEWYRYNPRFGLWCLMPLTYLLWILTVTFSKKKLHPFNATFNNISVILWLSVLLMEETGVCGEIHRLVASHWQILSHNVVSSTPRHERGSNSQL